MKIKKIDINNFGSYKNYTWINKDIEFKDVNKYFNYFVLNEEVKNKEIEFTTKKVKKI